MKNSPLPENPGKILRVKEGFNPNSSSVGSQIHLFFAFALASGSLTVLVLNLLNAYDRKIRKGVVRRPKDSGDDD